MKGYIPKTTGEYEDDYCRCAKRGWKLKALDEVVENCAEVSDWVENTMITSFRANGKAAENVISGEIGCWCIGRKNNI